MAGKKLKKKRNAKNIENFGNRKPAIPVSNTYFYFQFFNFFFGKKLNNLMKIFFTFSNFSKTKEANLFFFHRHTGRIIAPVSPVSNINTRKFLLYSRMEASLMKFQINFPFNFFISVLTIIINNNETNMKIFVSPSNVHFFSVNV